MYHLLWWIKFKKIVEKSGNFVRPKSGNHDYTNAVYRLVYLKYKLKFVHCRKMSEPDVKLTGIWKHFNSYTIRGRANVSCLPFRYVFSISGNTCNGSFTLTETDSNSKPDFYIVLCGTFQTQLNSNSNPYSLFLCRTKIRIGVCTRVHLWQCKWVIKWSLNDINRPAK